MRKVVKHWRQQAPEPVYTQNVEGDATGETAAPAAGAADVARWGRR